MPIIVHINHGLRPEAEREADDVVAFAKRLGASGVVREVIVRGGASVEAAARDARYEALALCAEEFGARWVLLAHARSDQAETVLMRVLRGTGLVGVAGMAKVRGLYGRPLLGLSRAQTEAYCREHQLAYSHDPMNRDLRYTRVRMRHTWLPALRKENPQIVDALVGLADSARDHREVLDWAAQRVLEERQVGADAGLSLGEGFASLPDALATRALGLFVEEQGGVPLERRHLRDLLALCRAPTAGTRDLSVPGGRLSRRYDRLHWEPESGEAYSVRVEEGFVARRWQAGDRMRPRRLKGRSRKLSDLFADARIPAPDRALAWVVCCQQGEQAGEIVWAQHVGHAHGWEVPVHLVAEDANAPE